MFRIALAAAFIFSATPLFAQTIVGRATTVDGDTIQIRGSSIRLHGIDAPESAQACENQDGKSYRCGQQAALALSDKIRAANVSCEQRDTDRYGRIVAICSVGGQDLNAWMVSQGHAIAYRQYGLDYVRQEDDARKAKRGMWAGTFTPAWEWRKQNREGTLPGAPVPLTAQPGKPDCRIKGNINSKGEKIYHVPGGNSYERTRVNEAAGEKWFCSESEAAAAGFRAPRG